MREDFLHDETTRCFAMEFCDAAMMITDYNMVMNTYEYSSTQCDKTRACDKGIYFILREEYITIYYCK